MEVDGRGAILARGYEGSDRFLFAHHWSTKVNDKWYDPISTLSMKITWLWKSMTSAGETVAASSSR